MQPEFTAGLILIFGGPLLALLRLHPVNSTFTWKSYFVGALIGSSFGLALYLPLANFLTGTIEDPSQMIGALVFFGIPLMIISSQATILAGYFVKKSAG